MSNITSGGIALLTLDEAAERLSVTPRMMRRLYYERRVPFVRIGKHIRFRPVDLDAYIETHTEAAVR